MYFEMVSRQEKIASEQDTPFWKPVWVSCGIFESEIVKCGIFEHVLIAHARN